jgi:ABC-2 type transport system permease protein
MISLFKKEVNSFLSSAIGYVSIIVFLLATGTFMWVFNGTSNIFDMGESSMASFFVNAPNVFLFLIPAITMRLFSEENRTGTIELLLTKPISDTKIILSKFLAGVFLVMLALIPTLFYYYSIYQMGKPIGNIDHAATWGGYIGLLLLGGVFVAIGLFTSSLFKNQVVSFMVSLIICYVFYLGFDAISSQFDAPLDLLFQNIGIKSHYISIQRGVLDSRDIIYYLSMILFFLLLTRFALQSRKW